MALVKIAGETEKATGIYYEVDFNQKPIGFGGMGTVMRGVRVEESTGARIDVAIKFLFDDLPKNAVDRARREASIQLQNDNLVKMYGFVEINENGTQRLHVISELLDGIMLHDFLKGKIVNRKGEIIPFFENLYLKYTSDKDKFAVFLIKNILSGIMALHDAGFIHRDIDPSNIMLTTDGKIKLIDFGVARKISANSVVDEPQLTAVGHFIGKANYAAPELAIGDLQHQNETTDIYALGILFYQIITGDLPFHGPMAEVLEKQIKEPLPLQNITNIGIRRIILKATDKKQNLRFQSAAEFRVALENLEHLAQNSVISSSYKNNLWDTLLIKLASINIVILVILLLIVGVVLGIVVYFVIS